MYELNDYIICMDIGICQIRERLSEKDGNSLHKYLLKPIFNAQPLQVYEDSIIRKVLNKQEMFDLLDRIPFIRTIKTPYNNVLKELFEEALAQGDGVEWIKVIKTIYMRKKEKKVTEMDVVCDQLAKNYFHGEIAFVLDIPIDQVEDYIKNYINREIFD